MDSWEQSPFLNVPPSEWVAANRSAFAIRDGFPVTNGHSLVVSRRIIEAWWEATAEEQADMFTLVDQVRRQLDESHQPSAYNIGINVGEAAGQTVAHLHIHVIPRYDGDVPDPRGGVRHVIPGKGNYLAPPTDPTATLVAGPDTPFRPTLLRLLRDPAFDQIDLVVSFVMRSGLSIIDEPLTDALERGAAVRILTTDYLNVTDPGALTRLHDLAAEWPDGIQIKVFADPVTSFHPKGYLFRSSITGRAASYVGSSNLSRSGLDGGVEWNLGLDATQPMHDAFERLWRDPRALPLTDEWLQDYRRRRPEALPPSTSFIPEDEQALEAAQTAVEPRPIQREALDALEATRAAGHRAGLVVMATGLGKTWLAAFDANRPAFRKVLFIAHREEIINQSLDVFRRVQPEQSLGIYMGAQKDPHANIVFAGVQTLVRHLDEFDPHEYDYIVVDEFHHAAARSYRQVIDHFSPAFLLGLTATPDRMDGADLLGLCGDNLVYECNLVEGIDRSELVPFDYTGIRDVVDFDPIPWRNGKFDPAALTAAVETGERAEHAMTEWESRKGLRTLAFCVTTTHADFMAEFATVRGLRAVAVHSGPTSAPRRESVQRLEAGDLDILFAVDVFNEGFDLPSIDTVLMLRPTDSPVIFLQQLGRGLRLDEDKDKLTVIDFIGNHRSFLMKPRTLLGLGTPNVPSNAELLEAVQGGEWALPEGCAINWSLDAVDLLSELARQRQPKRPGDALLEYLRTHLIEFGERATAMQALRAGLNPSSARKPHGGWFGLLQHLEQLTEDEQKVWDTHRDVLAELITTGMQKSYKAVLLRALIHDGTLLTGTSVAQLAASSHELVKADPRLVEDARTEDMPDSVAAPAEQWARMWRANPITALSGGFSKGQGLWRLEGDRFTPTFTVAPDDADTFVAMVAEIVEWRLAEYLLKRRPATRDAGAIEMSVSHSSGKPIIRFDRKRNPAIPEGPTRLVVEGEVYEGDFVKVALNVVRREGERDNVLPALMRGWFGPSAGLPGSRHRVLLEQTGEDWVVRPLGLTAGTGGTVLPLFPDFAVACGAFGDPDRRVQQGVGLELLGEGAEHDPSEEFVAVARGDSMAGGADAVRDGDLVLMRWARDVDRTDLIGHRVLVEYDGAPALKSLDRDGSGFLLRSDNPTVAPMPATSGMTIVAEYVRTLQQREFNPLAEHIGSTFRREAVATLYGEVFNPGNWRTGHVSLGQDVVLFITLQKAQMAEGSEYVDEFDGPGVLVWSSQNSTGPDTKKGKEILRAPEEGRRIHAWIRRRKQDVAFEYRGLVVPLSHTGDRPMSVRFRLLTPLDDQAAHRFSR